MIWNARRGIHSPINPLLTVTREASATAADLTEKLNKLLEDNAWLQTELEEQSSKTKESAQRMKDEIRGNSIIMC